MLAMQNILLALAAIWLEPLFLVVGVGAAVGVASDLVISLQIKLRTRQIALLTTLSIVFLLFETSSIFACPRILGLLMDKFGDSFGFGIHWS
jgi:hypothetical protein